jgi:TolB protein
MLQYAGLVSIQRFLPTGKEIFIADFDGANVKQITQNQSINLSPTWVPDGKKIAFTSYLRRNPDLYLIDVEGKNQQLFSRYPGLNVSPSWSPDGKHILATIETNYIKGESSNLAVNGSTSIYP